jgi:hypothetical protein
MALTKAEQLLYPKTMTERHFKDGADTRDFWNQKYAIETKVHNHQEEADFYESLNHEANIVLEIKLPSGVIK